MIVETGTWTVGSRVIEQHVYARLLYDRLYIDPSRSQHFLLTPVFAHQNQGTFPLSFSFIARILALGSCALIIIR